MSWVEEELEKIEISENIRWSTRSNQKTLGKEEWCNHFHQWKQSVWFKWICDLHSLCDDRSEK